MVSGASLHFPQHTVCWQGARTLLMHSGVVRSCLLLLAMAPCAPAFAHGEPPTAMAVLSHDEQGPRAVRLSAGIALRRSPQRYQFVCPAAWGDQFPAAVAALPDGTLLVGATQGLMLLNADGTLRPHPDPAALGHSSDVVRSVHGVFSVRMAAEGSEVLAVDAQQVRVLWTDPKVLYSLAAFDDKLLLSRGERVTVEQVTLAATSGALLDRQEAKVNTTLDYVFARATAGMPYALVMLRSSAILGTLRMNAFTTLATAEVSIAGPLQLEDETLFAIDGVLSRRVGEEMRPLGDNHVVHCLGEDDGLAYACDRDGIARLHSGTLGEPLFQLSWLTGPNLEQVAAEDARSRCSAQWQEMRADLRLAGTTLLADTLLDAGTTTDAATDQNQTALADARTDQLDARPAEPPKNAADSCSASHGRDSSRTAFLQICSLLFMLALARRTARARPA